MCVAGPFARGNSGHTVANEIDSEAPECFFFFFFHEIFVANRRRSADRAHRRKGEERLFAFNAGTRDPIF